MADCSRQAQSNKKPLKPASQLIGVEGKATELGSDADGDGDADGDDGGRDLVC